MISRVTLVSLALCLFAGGAMAQSANNGVIQGYAALRDMDLLTCRTMSLSARLATDRAPNSADAEKTKREYWDCLSKASKEAKEALPKAISSTKSKDVKDALKTYYAAWDAYLGDLDKRQSKTLKDNYETAKSKLDVELLTE